MKTKVFCLVLALALSSSAIFGQGFKPPAKNKAVIYFVSAKKRLITFEFFHYDKFIGELEKLNYMRYECDPGQQLLWASSENKEFLEANLEAGKSYVVKVETREGFWRLNPRFTPINAEHAFFAQAAALIKSKAPYNIPEAEIKARQLKLTEFIANILDLYKTDWKNKQEILVLTPNMAIPEEKMK
jgi:hypothetical protein